MTARPRRRRPFRPKTISAQGLTGQQGVHFIEGIVLKMGSRWTASGPNEVGIDGYIELFDPTSREALGLTFAVQSKVVTDITNKGTTFDYRCDPSDIEYWLRGNTPVILIVSNPDTSEGYWICIQEYFKDWKPSAPTRVTFNKALHRFDVTSLRSLAEIAAPTQGLYWAPTRRKEMLWSNLIAVDGLAPRVFLGETDCRTQRDVWSLLGKSKYEPACGWVLWEKKLLSFDDLSGRPWNAICDRGTVESFETAEWSATSDPQRQRLFVQLLNQTLRAQISLQVRYWPDEECFAMGGRPRKMPYRSLKRNSRLSVVREYTTKSKDGRVFFHYRHLAFRGHFQRFDGKWYLEVTPTYRFTRDGYTLDMFHESRLKGIKEIEGNRAVLSAVLFWADFLRPKNVLFTESSLQLGQLMTQQLDVGIDDKTWLEKDPEFDKDEDSDSFDLFAPESVGDSEE